MYQKQPRTIRRIESTFPIVAVYSGGKTPTPEVIRRVQTLKNNHPDVVDGIFDTVDASCVEAEIAIRNKNWADFGELMNVNQGLMDALGVSNARLSEIVYRLRRDDGIFGAKISGAGLGDCVVGVGQIKKTEPGFETVSVEIEKNGLEVD